MTIRRHSLLRPLGLLGALACPVVLVVLFEIRPPLPTLPASFSSLITLELVRGVLEFAAWGASLALAGVLLMHSLRLLFAPGRTSGQRTRLDPRTRRRPLGQARLAAGALQGGFPPPFPLIVRSRIEPASEVAEGVARAPKPVAATTTQALRAEERMLRSTPPCWEELPPPSIALLGKLKIAVSEPGRYGLRSQTQQLLAYLALRPEGATTDELVAALCPNVGERIGRKRLWRSVSEARSQLGDIILRADERYQLDRGAVAVDADHFEELAAAAAVAEPGAEREQLLERALALVRGQPLAGADYPWAAGEIRRLRAIVVERLGGLGQLRLDDGDAAGALAAAEQALQLDAYHEAGHRLAMQAEAALGLRQAIIQRYEQFSRELDTALGLEPERKTRLLYRRLLSQDAESASVSTESS